MKKNLRSLKTLTPSVSPLVAQALWLAAAAVSLASVSQADFSSITTRGEARIEIPKSGGKPAELCFIPKHLHAADYSKSDLKDEKTLCGLNEAVNAAVCPKLNSTNPGLNFYEVGEGQTSAQLVASQCEGVKGAGGKIVKPEMVAKYKLSTSCSYAPSILGYYHLSRRLGDAALVPVAVLRTFDREDHLNIANKALSKAPAGSIINATWSSLRDQLALGARSPKRALLMNERGDQSFGALLVNPGGESFYKEFFNGGANNVARTQALKSANPIVLQLAKSTDIENLVGRQFNLANVQRMVQLKDASDMIVMDTIMSQQDRMGNIHQVTRYAYLDVNQRDPQGRPTLKIEKKLTPEQIKSLGAVAIKQMILKDNDCGVAKDNVSRKVNLIAAVSHISPLTYRRVLEMNRDADGASMKNEFAQEYLFTARDYTNFRENLKLVATTLAAGCRSGQVKLDLDLQAHFNSESIGASCELN